MEPLKHELEAAMLMSKQSRVLLFDAMGVGKTVSTLLALQQLKQAQIGSFRAVICVPNTIAGQWADEVHTWLKWNCLVACGDKTEREKQYYAFKNTDEYPILITTYGNFIKDDFFQSFTAECLVLDEGWLFRNRNTKLYCQLQSVIPKYSKCFLLSGNFEAFSDRQFYSLTDLMFPDQFVITDKKSLVIQLGDAFISRDLKSVTMDNFMCPTAWYHLHDFECSIKQKELLTEISLEENRAIKNGSGASVLRTLLNKKMAVLNSPRILDASLELSPKEQWILKTVKEYGKKIVVYCPDRKFFDLLHKDFILADINCVAVSGKMSAKMRTRNLNVFNNDPNYKCLLLAGVGKFGLNLQCANMLIFATVPKSWFEHEQLVGRLVRLNQNSVVSSEVIYMYGTVEAQMVHDVLADH